MADNILQSIFDRILRHRHAPRDLSRIVNEDAPLVAQAAQQPQVAGALLNIARERGQPVEETRRQWESLQEADLLLESSGDPEAVSASHAVGVAQWLAGTARSHGLPVDLAASDRLTPLINHLKWKIAWCAYLGRPGSDAQAPGRPPLTAAQAAAQLPGLRTALAALEQKRRRVDARYDSRQAIFAQTRYLLNLYARFPDYAWLFQAYHGGEGGVQRTLRKYLAGHWPGSAAAAIRA
ncbi:MAG TPA: transglycosylase SLT domain-containing protein, partial [Chthonomonadaceae bacterium]|nr:transglycosylase SLT domain-containing protein [Chthonomonadaceae bacterium]